MSLTNQDIITLEEIVSTDGKCMDSKRCRKCPFRAMCLPEFLNPIPPTAKERSMMAIDVLSHHAFIDDQLSVEEYDWNKK